MINMLFLNIGGAEIVVLTLILLVSLVPLMLGVIALIDLFKRDFGDKTTDRIMYIILIVFAPFIGSLLYLLSLRKSYPLKHETYQHEKI